jgi:transcriptional regulator with XRE-family HTH domain
MPRKVVNGDAVRDIRELAGYTLDGLAAEVGITRQALTKIEAGDNGMMPRNIRRAARALTVPTPALTQDAYTPAEVAMRLGIPPHKVAALIASGEFPVISGCVPETALEEHIARGLPESVTA